ncbi:MAG TPA: hypothetical protein VFE07_08825 [Marmoricola sp.]|nr:hypothetical protein [Marmoricola sp.]
MTPIPGHPTSTAPWFRAYPRLALLVATVLFLLVLVLRLRTGTANDASSMLYVLPVALVAMSRGARAGLVAGSVAVALIVIWTVARDVSLGPLAWTSRVVPLLLLGALVGDASDRLRRADAERHRLEAAARIHREAVEINDSIVQGMVTAKWALESGQLEPGLGTLSATITRAQELVSDLIRQAGTGSRSVALEGSAGDRRDERHDAMHRDPM